MSFTDNFGLIFNCGFCRTLVYECFSMKTTKGDKKNENRPSKKESSDESGDGIQNETDKKQVRPNLVETFKSQFIGPRYSVGADYFESSDKRPSLFERHAKRLMKSWGRQFNPRSEAGLKQTYLSTFSSLNWNELGLNEKAAHSLSNCYACANTFPKLQKSFPLAPTYEPNNHSESVSEKSFIENEYPKFDSLCKQAVGQPFSVLANRHPNKLGLRDTDSEVQKAIGDTQRKCTAECNASLEKSTLQAAYSTDLSFSRLQRYRKAQYYDPPNELSKKKETLFTSVPSVQ